MARRMSRRAFLTATAATGSVAAAGGLFMLLEQDGAPPPTPTPTSNAASQPVTPTSTMATVSGPADGYVAVAPRVFRPGQIQSVSLALFKGEQAARDRVNVALAKDGSVVSRASGEIAGRGVLSLSLPALADGEYQLTVSAREFEDTAAVQVEDGTLVFIETDRPIYKPGQTVHIRVLALDQALRPAGGEATVEVSDAKGIKIFKKTAAADEFGMAALDLPLSTEPNLGVWKIRATIGRRTGQVDVRVERYVLPKYEVTLTLPKTWALADEVISGTVGAEYTFGKPVNGEVEIVASRYVGTWQEYARVSRPIDGKLSFDVPAVRYAAGSPAGGGLAHVQLSVTVREQATGYEETTSQLVAIASSPTSVRVIPESATFKPGLPFQMLVVAETPDKQPVERAVKLRLTYERSEKAPSQETREVTTRNGLTELTLTPPADAVSLYVQPEANGASALPLTIRAGYSPSGAFIHLRQETQGPLKVGDTARFTIAATRESANFYYEVVGRGMVVYSDFSRQARIDVPLTPMMAPEARLLVYQILPGTTELAADYLPLTVEGNYPQSVQVSFDRAEAKPGDEVEVRVQTEGAARVGLAAVDRAVFILAENRLNLRQVFDELERLYQKPQIELHEAQPIGFPGPGGIAIDRVPGAPGVVAPGGVGMGANVIPGAREMFQYAGLVVLSNRNVPEGKPYQQMGRNVLAMPAAAGSAAKASTEDDAAEDAQLAEVQRVRQFFPETWLWSSLSSDAGGRASQKTTAPDSITTWMVRAVGLSKERGFGVGEAELRVFQPFFVQVDLPYAITRGEELPARIALYNYTAAAEQFTVDLETADWFDPLGARSRTVTVEPNGVGALEFPIRPTGLGVRALKVTARSRSTADAIVKEVIVEPEGVQRELVENLVLAPGAARDVELAIPAGAIPGSARVYLALTGNVLAQTMEGLEGLIRMPFGCGEQNMLLFAPNVFVSRYLKETGQLKPEVMAKAEVMMLTGYQRELTYRRGDGSFSAFGQSDKEGSLWLTGFVLKTFAQGRDLIYIDDDVLATARGWIRGHQQADGSFDPVGFVTHKELLGGLKGKAALTAFTAIALREAGDEDGAGRTERYLETVPDQATDPYTLAIATYALALGKNRRAGAARDALMAQARENDAGLFWGGDPGPAPAAGASSLSRQPEPRNSSAAIETTGYAALALLQLGERLDAGRAIRWLASQRNALGGYGSTQDTVVALQAMATSAASSRTDVDATLTLQSGIWRKDVRVAPDNADVVQIIDVPAAGGLTIETTGKGQVQAQVVQRFNVPDVERGEPSAFQVQVDYGADQVEVDDLITVTASVTFTPPEPVAAGMVVLDVAIPTGFAPETASLEALASREPKLKRFDVAGRKVIFYIEDMLPNDRVRLSFQARALYPVKAQANSSQAYAYYRPEWKGETLGGRMLVAER